MDKICKFSSCEKKTRKRCAACGDKASELAQKIGYYCGTQHLHADWERHQHECLGTVFEFMDILTTETDQGESLEERVEKIRNQKVLELELEKSKKQRKRDIKEHHQMCLLSQNELKEMKESMETERTNSNERITQLQKQLLEQIEMMHKKSLENDRLRDEIESLQNDEKINYTTEVQVDLQVENLDLQDDIVQLEVKCANLDKKLKVFHGDSNAISKLSYNEMITVENKLELAKNALRDKFDEWDGCVICLEVGNPLGICLPCKHQDMCLVCRENQANCPICRTEISDFIIPTPVEYGSSINQ